MSAQSDVRDFTSNAEITSSTGFRGRYEVSNQSIYGSLINTPLTIQTQAYSVNSRIGSFKWNETGSTFAPIQFDSIQPLKLWKGSHVMFDGQSSQMPGLIDVQSGIVSIGQQFGNFHLSATIIANKYWMSMNRNLQTQYGFGGSVCYVISDKVSLNAFGYYYNNNPIVDHAFVPYVRTSNFGGYADIKWGENWGANIGVRRYVNPMTGRWITDPIVDPYIKVGKTRIEFPVGSLLKAAVRGARFDDPMRPMAQPKQQKPRKR